MVTGSRSRLTVVNEREIPPEPTEEELAPAPTTSSNLEAQELTLRIMMEMLETHRKKIDEQHKNVMDFAVGMAGAAGSRLGRYALPTLTTAAGFWLWNSALANPTNAQLIALGLFGALVEIPILWLTLRGK